MCNYKPLIYKYDCSTTGKSRKKSAGPVATKPTSVLGESGLAADGDDGDDRNGSKNHVPR